MMMLSFVVSSLLLLIPLLTAAAAQQATVEMDVQGQALTPDTILQQLTIHVHRNGQPQACGTAPPSDAELPQQIMDAMRTTSASSSIHDNKYALEAFLDAVLDDSIRPALSIGGPV